MVWSTLLTIPRTIFCIILVWIVSIRAGVLVPIGDDNFLHARFFIYLVVELSVLFFIATHVNIFLVIQRREEGRKETSSDQDSLLRNPCLTTQETKGASHITHQNMIIFVTIVLAVLIVTCVPLFVCLNMSYTENTFDRSLASRVDLHFYDNSLHYSDAFFYVHFIANPFIYAWRLRMYRKAFHSLLGGSST